MRKDLQTIFSPIQKMRSTNYELYYYNDMNLESVSGHSHDYYEFYFFIGGNVSIMIDEEYHLTPGDVVLIPPGVPHQLINHDSSIAYERFVFWISKDFCNALLMLSSDLGFIMQHVLTQKNYVHHFSKMEFNSLQNKVFTILEETHSNRFGKDAKLNLAVSDLVLYLNRVIYEQLHPDYTKEGSNLYENVLTYLDLNLTNEITLDSLAKEFFVSKYYISHVFKENMGLSLHQYLLKKRLAKSAEAIRANASITETYYDYGFHDYSSFYRAFKKEYGISPKEYQTLYNMNQEL